MNVNAENKYTSEAEYYYNSHIDMWCVVDTTISMDDNLEELKALWSDSSLLVEVGMPDYIDGADYDGPTW